MKRIRMLLLMVLCLMLCLTACKKEEKKKTSDSNGYSYNNTDQDEMTQAILKEMLGENSDLDHILYDLSFPMRVNEKQVRFQVLDSPISMSKEGKLTGQNQQQEKVTIKVSFKDGEKYFQATVLAGEEKMKAYVEQIGDTLIPNADNVRGNLSLVETAGENGEIEISWKSADTGIITDKASGENGNTPAGVVTRGMEDKTVVLTATLTWNGNSITKEIPVTVKAKPEEKVYDAYVYTYFRGNIYGNGESQHIHMATSEDGLHWSALNNNEAILKATEGTRGVRDSFLLRSHDGDHFYLIGTDLDANGGDWGAYGNNGSRNICVWESDDLVNWSEERLVEIAPKNAGCMWAPEAFYDETTGEYVVYWATGIRGGNGKKIYYAKTRDFYHFTQAQVYKDVENGITFIDTTMTEYEGTYYRFTKNEQELSILMETSNQVLGDFTQIKTKIAGETGVEGPAIYKINGQEKWCLYMDGYAFGNSGVGYFPLIAESLEDLKMANFRKLKPEEYELPPGAKHGSFVPITKEEYQALQEKWG